MFGRDISFSLSAQYKLVTPINHFINKVVFYVSFPVVVEAHVSHQQNFAMGEEAREFAVSLLQVFTSEPRTFQNDFYKASQD